MALDFWRTIPRAQEDFSTQMLEVTLRIRNLLPALHRALKGVLPRRPLPFPVRGGVVYLDLGDSHKALERVLGLYEPDKTAVLGRLLRPAMTFVDIGAAKGDFSVMAAALVGREGVVVAVEPEPENYRWLQLSVVRSGHKNIRVLKLAAGADDGRGRLFLSQRSEWHSLLDGQPERNKGTSEVEIRTLDSILATFRSVDMIKIDAEGAEADILCGAENTLARNPGLVLLMDLHPGMGTRPAAIVAWLSDRGFSVFEMQAPNHLLTNIRPDLRELIATRDEGNIAALR